MVANASDNISVNRFPFENEGLVLREVKILKEWEHLLHTGKITAEQKTAYLKWKRILDLTFALLAFILLLPLFLLIALAIKLESRGPIIFKQKRLGQHGKPFYILKFRTMYVDGEERLKKYFLQNPRALQEVLSNIKKDPQLNGKLTEKELLNNPQWLTYWKLRNDPRITRAGRVLRRFSLDELPQIINIIRGEMSIVGPRPYMPHERAEMGTLGDKILSVKPGLTGLWQVSGRASRTLRERLWLDAFYVDKMSMLLDLWIILRTIPVVISGKGAN